MQINIIHIFKISKSWTFNNNNTLMFKNKEINLLIMR